MIIIKMSDLKILNESLGQGQVQGHAITPIDSDYRYNVVL